MNTHSNREMEINWNPNSWKRLPVRQQPSWPDERAYKNVIQKISNLPALVFAGETRELRQQLANVNKGGAFVLQCGDCAEAFDLCRGKRVHGLLNLILQLVAILGAEGGKRVVSIGRIAGQYAKPRSKDYEDVDGVSMPVYRGDMVNSCVPDPALRVPDPDRILEGYYLSGITLNLLRAFAQGGYSNASMGMMWARDTVDSQDSAKYEDVVSGLNKSLVVLESLGYDLRKDSKPAFHLFTSHEALLLDYESALTRVDSITEKWYATSAHMVWVGERTREANEGHIEYIRGIENPVGVKVGPSARVGELLGLADRVNPNREEGKLIFICRIGAAKINELLPKIVATVGESRKDIIWICDPMHGNTFTTRNGNKTRCVEDILFEIERFFAILRDHDITPGGIHLEVTPDAVTECVGGACNLTEDDLKLNYATLCDPRLNPKQARDIVSHVGAMLESRK